MKKVDVVILLISLFTIKTVFAEGYEIKVKINNISNEEIYLGYHFGSKLYVSDTTILDNSGKGVFKGEEELKGGLYLIFLPNKTYFDIIIGDNQYFTIENDTSDFVKNIKFISSNVNQNFYNYQRFLMDNQEKLKDLRDEKKKYEENDEEDKAKKVQEEMEALNKIVMGEMDQVIGKNQDNFLSKLLTASKDVDIPEAPKDENGNIIDSLFQYKYYKEHFFDNIDFSDHRLLRTPFVETKLKQYFSAIPQIPDSLLPLIDSILIKAQADSTVFQFTLSFLFNHFLKSNIMGMDKVYVHIGEKYYLSGLAPWADSTFITKLSDRVNKIKPNLIGNISPDLKMVTENNQWIRLHDINAKYIILIFWETSCGHCKKAIPKIYKTYEKYKNNGVAVFAVYTQYKKDKWLEFLKEKNLNWINVYDPYNISNFRDLYDIYSTPVIYLIDEDKKIVAKRLGPGDIEDFLSREFD